MQTSQHKLLFEVFKKSSDTVTHFCESTFRLHSFKQPFKARGLFSPSCPLVQVQGGAEQEQNSLPLGCVPFPSTL